MNKKFEIIAETAFSHQGNFNYLLRQIDAAKKAKADYVKLQILVDKKTYYVHNHPSYQRIERLIIDKISWLEAFKYAKSLKLKLIVLPLDINSLKFCLENEIYINAYEIHPVSLNEYYLLKELRNTSKHIILGIGGWIPEEIDYAIKILKASSKKTILMFGFQSFPTEIEYINLSKIKSLTRKYSFKIGYADHTGFNNDFFHNLIEFAYLLGARIFEKHIVLEKGKPRVDYEAAIISKDFLELRKRLDDLTEILGEKG